MMNGTRKARMLALLGSLALAGSLSACREARLASAWPPVPVAIDGSAREWAGREAYYDPKEGIKIGFFNDDQYVYVYFATWHRETQARILANGFTSWYDVSGGKKKTYGIIYPLGRRSAGEGQPGGDWAGAPPRGQEEGYPGGEAPRGAGTLPRDFRPGAQGDAESSPAMMERLLSASRNDLAIIDASNDTIYVPTAVDSGGAGVVAMMGIANRTLVIELRIPLDKSGSVPYALAAGPGDLIGVGFEIGDMERPRMRPTQDGAPDMGGQSPGGFGGGPGFGGGGGMGPPGMEGDFSERFAMWAKVTLASRP